MGCFMESYRVKQFELWKLKARYIMGTVNDRNVTQEKWQRQ